jgi:SAM-dependent MidA family methyltransferase
LRLSLAHPHSTIAPMPNCQTRISQAIDQAGGWLRFDHYMALALYAPGVGYYERRDHQRTGESGGPIGPVGPVGPIGPASRGGDFITAPALTPLFAKALSTQLIEWFDAGPPRILEFGAGTGQLAADLLVACAQAGHVPETYEIIELSSAMRERQRANLARIPAELAARVRWLDRLPEQIDGVVLANELLDALPVRLFVADCGQVMERGVVNRVTDGGAPGILGEATSAGAHFPGQNPFAWSDRAADPEFAQAVTRAIEEAGWSVADARNYVSEWPEQAIGWTASIAERIRHGALLLIDYGFPRSEFYHPARHTGTLMCHAQHRSHPDPLLDPGQRDITAHVDFSKISATVTHAGMRCAGYTSQARFLLNCGLLDHLSALPPTAAREHSAQIAAVQLLLSEAEMGELFKVIAFTRGMPETTPLGFRQGNRSMSLERRS